MHIQSMCVQACLIIKLGTPPKWIELHMHDKRYILLIKPFIPVNEPSYKTAYAIYMTATSKLEYAIILSKLQILIIYAATMSIRIR